MWRDSSRQISVSVVTTDSAGNELILNSRDLVKVTVIQTAVAGNSTSVGNFCSDRLDVTYGSESVPLVGSQWNNRKISIFTAESQNTERLGVFYGQKCETKDNGRTYTVTMSSVPARMAEVYDTSTGETDPAVIANTIASYCGLGYADEYVWNIPPIEAVPENCTNAQMLGYLAGCMGCNIRMNADGLIERYAYATEDLYKIYRRQQKLGGLAYAPVVTVTAVAAAYGETVYTSGSGEALAYSTPYASQQLADAVLTTVTGVATTTGKLKWFGDPAVRAGDVVSVETTEGWLPFIVAKQTITLDGGYSSDIEAKPFSVASGVATPVPTMEKVQIMYSGIRQIIADMSEYFMHTGQGYFRDLYDDNNERIGWTITDSFPVTDTTSGWMWDLGGLRHSSDGFRTVDRTAITADGRILGSAIAAGSIQLDALEGDASRLFKRVLITNDKIRLLSQDYVGDPANAEISTAEAQIDSSGLYIKYNGVNQSYFTLTEAYNSNLYVGHWLQVAKVRSTEVEDTEWDGTTSVGRGNFWVGGALNGN